jgi:deoxycytidine triphosphate deaminase
MILTDKTIIDEIALKNIVIEPLIEANIGTNSVDLTLSNTLLMYTDHILDTLPQLSNIRRHFAMFQ